MFLPFWKLFTAFFCYFLTLEGLKKIGLIQENKK